MNENIRTIEVNGVKMEVDMRYAKRIDTFKVGDTVKVLDKRNGKNDMRCGVITDFANFKDLPTMMVAVYRQPEYSWNSPSIEFIPYNSDTKDIEIVGVSNEELQVSHFSVVEMFDSQIQKKRDELNDLIVKRDTFVRYFLPDREAEIMKVLMNDFEDTSSDNSTELE